MIEITLKIVLEFVIAIMSIIVATNSHRVFRKVKNNSFELIFYGFATLAISMTLELADSFVFKHIIDPIQLISAIIGMILILMGLFEMKENK